MLVICQARQPHCESFICSSNYLKSCLDMSSISGCQASRCHCNQCGVTVTPEPVLRGTGHRKPAMGTPVITHNKCFGSKRKPCRQSLLKQDVVTFIGCRFWSECVSGMCNGSVPICEYESALCGSAGQDSVAVNRKLLVQIPESAEWYHCWALEQGLYPAFSPLLSTG